MSCVRTRLELEYIWHGSSKAAPGTLRTNASCRKIRTPISDRSHFDRKLTRFLRSWVSVSIAQRKSCKFPTSPRYRSVTTRLRYPEARL